MNRTKPRPKAPAVTAAPASRWPLAVVLLASATAWGVLMGAFPPAGQNFPLNDDWAFARGAFLFAQGEGIHYAGWASMPQLGQWLWACPFLWLLGASHFALRVSTIVLSWLGLWAFYDLLRGEGVERRPAAFATATLAFSPLFFLLQGTFLTDVPALALSLAALALYRRGFADNRPALLAAGCAVAVLAAVTRQNTVAVAAAAGLLLWRTPALRRNPLALGAVLLPFAAGLVAHVWFGRRADGVPAVPGVPPPDLVLLLPFAVTHFLGLASLPALALDPWPRSWKSFALTLAVLAGCALYWAGNASYLPYGGLFPYTENMLTPWGAFAGSQFTGPLQVGHRPVLLGWGARLVLTAVGCVAGALLVLRLIERVRAGTPAGPILLYSLCQIPFLLIAPEFYDRYLLVLVPGALALAVERQPASAPRWLPGLGVLVAVGLVSVCLMHDWLAWNAARWELGRRALERHIPARAIEGGFEWDGWFGPGRQTPVRSARPPGLTLPLIHRRFGHVTGRFALSFSEVRGTTRIDSQPYSLWLPPGRHEFFLIRLDLAPRHSGQAPQGR